MKYLSILLKSAGINLFKGYNGFIDPKGKFIPLVEGYDHEYTMKYLYDSGQIEVPAEILEDTEVDSGDNIGNRCIDYALSMGWTKVSFWEIMRRDQSGYQEFYSDIYSLDVYRNVRNFIKKIPEGEITVYLGKKSFTGDKYDFLQRGMR